MNNNTSDKIKIFRTLSKETIDKILACSKIKEYKKDDMVFSEKEVLKELYFIVEGVVSIYKPNKMDDGKKVVYIFGNGEILNEMALDNKPSLISCELLTDGKILIVDKEDFRKIMHNDIALCEAVINSLIIKQKRTIHQLKNMSSKTVDMLLAFKLWKLAKDFGKKTDEGIEIDFDLPVKYLAEFLGNKRETVSRQIKVLTNKNLIKTNKKRFIILDSQKLINYFRGVEK